MFWGFQGCLYQYVYFKLNGKGNFTVGLQLTERVVWINEMFDEYLSALYFLLWKTKLGAYGYKVLGICKWYYLNLGFWVTDTLG